MQSTTNDTVTLEQPRSDLTQSYARVIMDGLMRVLRGRTDMTAIDLVRGLYGHASIVETTDPKSFHSEEDGVRQIGISGNVFACRVLMPMTEEGVEVLLWYAILWYWPTFHPKTNKGFRGLGSRIIDDINDPITCEAFHLVARSLAIVMTKAMV